MWGAIEAGGTKFVLGIGDADGNIAARTIIPTRDPADTIAEAVAWIKGQCAIDGLGIGTFGPVRLDRAATDWGHILATPKAGWAHYDLAGTLASALNVPVALDTDVNAAALAEAHARPGAVSLAYMTVGTGIGVGLVLEGRCVHGAAHPEMGHIYPRRPAGDDDFAGICPYHGDCLEGLASGSAIRRRWGASLSELPPEHEAHGLIAAYLAEACHTLFATVSVETVVIGGGVLGTPGLLDRIAAKTSALDAGYLPGGEDHRVSAPVLGTDSGLLGALLLAANSTEAPGA